MHNGVSGVTVFARVLVTADSQAARLDANCDPVRTKSGNFSVHGNMIVNGGGRVGFLPGGVRHDRFCAWPYLPQMFRVQSVDVHVSHAQVRASRTSTMISHS